MYFGMEFAYEKVKIPQYTKIKDSDKMFYFHFQPNRWSYTVTKFHSGLVRIFYHSIPQQEKPCVEQTELQNS